MDYSYKVSIWKLQTRRNAQGKVTSYRVRWFVDGDEFGESFKSRPQADGFRSELISAQRRGEPFATTEPGLPLSRSRPADNMSWYDFTVAYVDMKWPSAAASARQTIADALIRVMPVFVPKNKKAPAPKAVRSALRQWGYNTTARNSGSVPKKEQEVLDWLSRNTLAVRTAGEPDTTRALQAAVTRRLDGQPFAPAVARKTRAVLWNVLDYAVEKKHFDANPLAGSKWTDMPSGKRKVDKRAVPNPVQARTLLAAVRQTQRSGPRLVAFFGTMYFAALRPEEAAALNKRHLSLPCPKWNEEAEKFEYEWGELYLDDANPHVGGRWTDSGKPRDQRQLKSRSVGEGRTVPCPPELTQLLHEHMKRYPPAADGRIFSGEKGGEVPMITYTRAWRAARRAALTSEARRGPLARRPYELRHAAVSTWLTGGVEPARVAEWAGHSVSVLYEVYAAFLDGGDELARKRVQAALGHRA